MIAYETILWASILYRFDATPPGATRVAPCPGSGVQWMQQDRAQLQGGFLGVLQSLGNSDAFRMAPGVFRVTDRTDRFQAAYAQNRRVFQKQRGPCASLIWPRQLLWSRSF